jgi:hypothetical protein
MAAIGPSRHSLQCSIIPAFGVKAAMKGSAAAWCRYCLAGCHAGLFSIRHDRGTPAYDPAALPMGYDGLAQVAVACELLVIRPRSLGRTKVRKLPSLGSCGHCPERGQGEAGEAAAAGAGLRHKPDDRVPQGRPKPPFRGLSRQSVADRSRERRGPRKFKCRSAARSPSMMSREPEHSR